MVLQFGALQQKIDGIHDIETRQNNSVRIIARDKKFSHVIHLYEKLSILL